MKTSSRVLIGLSAVFLASCSSGGIHHEASTAPLAQEVRRATDRYQDVSAATAAGYALFLCTNHSLNSRQQRGRAD